MELQFQNGTCRCLKAAAHEVRNTELTQEVRLNDGMPDIGRVLTSWGQVILRSKEWQGSFITVSGGVMVWILYVPEDGTPPRCMETWVPFQLKWELEQSGGEGPIRIDPLLRFVDSRSISARKMIVRVSVAAMGEALLPASVQIFYPGELPEDLQILKNTYPIRIPKEAGEKTFLLDEELQLPNGTAKPERLMAYTILPQLQEKRVAGDKVVLRGSGKIHIIYRCDEGNIHSVDLEIPFSQYAQLEDTYGNDAQADMMLGITSLELIQSDDAQLRVKCGLVAQYLITDRFLAEVVEDVYSTRRDVELHMEELNLPAVLEQRSEMIQLQQKLPGMDGQLVDIVFLPDVPRQNRDGDHIALELPGQFQLLYLAQDGSLQGSIVRWETSMRIMADPGSGMNFTVQPYAAIQAVPDGDGLSLNGQLKLEMQAQTQTTIPMIGGLDLGQVEEPDPARASLILCRAEDESIWNIAKRCGSTVDDIQRINHLNGQPLPNQMLLIPIA